MNFSPEIKHFTKNTLILTLLLVLVFHLSWTYLRPYLREVSYADNTASFKMSDVTFLGNFATALSLNIGLGANQSQKAPVALSPEVISIADALSNTRSGNRSLITDNMNAIASYANILQIDIPEMLDRAPDRAKALDTHIALLKSYYTKTKDRLDIIAGQMSELKNIISENNSAVAEEKSIISISYKGQDPSTLERSLESYMKLKQDVVKSQTYIVFLEKFQSSFEKLQSENARILDTLINNREAIIKQATIVIPDTGTDLMKELDLIKTEVQAKSEQ